MEYKDDDERDSHVQSSSISTTTSASTSTTTSTKTYLNMTAHGVQVAALRTLVERMKQTARYFIHGYNTCNVERYHRERLRFTPKLLEFWTTWTPRCALNQLIHNHGWAETHRRVLVKLADLPAWSLGIEAGNPYMAAMDRQRAYQSARKSAPEYNQRQKRLACEHGQRRATHERASHSRGHDYQHTPPLYVEDENGEEVKRKRKARRSKEQMDADKAEEQAEKRRLAVLFERGDTTFTTLGVIDVNLQPKGTRGRKKGKCDDELESEDAGKEAGKDAGKEAGKGEKGTGKDEQGSETGTADKENSDPSLPSVPRKRQRRVERTPVERKARSAEQTPTMAVVVMDMAAAGRQSAASAPVSCVQPDSVAARAIMFR